MTKSMIAPIIAVLVLLVQAIFHVQIPDDMVSQITDCSVNVIAIVLAIYGIFKNHKKEDDKK